MPITPTRLLGGGRDREDQREAEHVRCLPYDLLLALVDRALHAFALLTLSPTAYEERKARAVAAVVARHAQVRKSRLLCPRVVLARSPARMVCTRR